MGAEGEKERLTESKKEERKKGQKCCRVAQHADWCSGSRPSLHRIIKVKTSCRTPSCALAHYVVSA